MGEDRRLPLSRSSFLSFIFSFSPPLSCFLFSSASSRAFLTRSSISRSRLVVSTGLAPPNIASDFVFLSSSFSFSSCSFDLSLSSTSRSLLEVSTGLAPPNIALLLSLLVVPSIGLVLG